MSMKSGGRSKNYVGIDLGTTFSAVAHLDSRGTVSTLPNAEGEMSTHSAVLIDDSGEVIVGREAKRSILIEPDSVADRVKRDMGDAYFRHKLNGKQFSPSNISAMIIKKLKQDAETRIGPVAGGVITVPAYFDGLRRRATVAAGEIAGFEVIDIINEPTAAAIAYAFRDFVGRGGDEKDVANLSLNYDKPHHALVYDLGGGTFDVTILRIVGNEWTVLATDGNVSLGGCDWDACILDYAAAEFQKEYNQDPLADPQSYQALLLNAEEAKRDLSRLHKTKVIVTHGGKNLKVELTREKFESLTAKLIFLTEACLKGVIKQANLAWDDIDEVLAVGGSTRMPQVLNSLRKVTGKEPNCSLPPGEAIAHGAAIHAAMCVVQASPIRETRPQESEPEDAGASASSPAEALPEDDLFNIPISDDLPEGQKTDVFSLGADSFKLDPDEDADDHFEPEIVDKLRELKMQDVTSRSMGVSVRGGHKKQVNATIIPRNTQIPVSKTRKYVTICDNQTLVTIHVLQGESDDIDACIKLGKFQIRDLPPNLPKGSPVKVTFRIDSGGLLHVQATETTSGQSAATTLDCAASLDKESVERDKATLSRISVF